MKRRGFLMALLAVPAALVGLTQVVKNPKLVSRTRLESGIKPLDTSGLKEIFRPVYLSQQHAVGFKMSKESLLANRQYNDLVTQYFKRTWFERMEEGF